MHPPVKLIYDLVRPIVIHRMCSEVNLKTIPGSGGVNQAYSRLSTTHGHITEVSVVYAGVCVVIF